MKIRTRARLLAFGALVIALAAFIVSPALGGPSLRKLVKKEVSKQLSGKAGPQGPAGAPGAPGAAGAANVRRIDYAPTGCDDDTPCFADVLSAAGFTLNAECSEEVGVSRLPIIHLKLAITQSPAGGATNYTLVKRNGDVADNGGFAGTGQILDLVAGDAAANDAAAGVLILRGDAATLSVDIHTFVTDTGACQVFGTATQA